MKFSHPLAATSAWKPPVYFTPFVGDEYDKGLVDGVRVLLLGESHYGIASGEEGCGRDCTQYNFDGYTDESCDIDNQHQFFKKLPRIVARNPAITAPESAAAWRRVAFSNFVQEFVGANARMRPSGQQWKQGQLALAELAKKLRPNVILVLGAQLWNHITEGQSSNENPIAAERHERSVWLIDNGSGFARSSWIYHPSTNYESLQSAIGVFAELLRRAAASEPVGRRKGEESPLAKQQVDDHPDS
jgi:hypothetical protein